MKIADIYGSTHHYTLIESPHPHGAAVVFIHGWLLSACYWQPLMQRLSPYFTCLSYDLRGFGESAPGRADYSLRAYAQDVLALIDRLQLSQVWLVGHSLGGSIALWAAHLSPQRVKGVVCLNAGGGVYLRQAFEQFRTAGQQMVRYRHPLLAALPLLPTVFSRLMVERPLGHRWGQQRLMDFIRADADAARGALLESTTQAEVHQLPQLVSTLPQPAYFVAGAQDSIMEPRYVRHLASFHPDFAMGNLIELEGCGHFAMLERLEAVASTVCHAISQHTQANPVALTVEQLLSDPSAS
ncbi:MAG: alpha/beta hydrolase [Cyanobacteria bacterium P01_A01_bin.105]